MTDLIKRVDAVIQALGEAKQIARSIIDDTKDPAVDEWAEFERHTTSADCWCQPEVDYVDPETGDTVYVHRSTQ